MVQHWNVFVFDFRTTSPRTDRNHLKLVHGAGFNANKSTCPPVWQAKCANMCAANAGTSQYMGSIHRESTHHSDCVPCCHPRSLTAILVTTAGRQRDLKSMSGSDSRRPHLTRFHRMAASSRSLGQPSPVVRLTPSCSRLTLTLQCCVATRSSFKITANQSSLPTIMGTEIQCGMVAANYMCRPKHLLFVWKQSM